ncbi:MAG TPA: class I lanthipeptide [Candidatus Deferrimicrobium sp.]|nr:class I lanthipeptide [Candidatus Kapabacteria bacterium]HLP59926.1 class I lanthipeptide [Candidatus Deferrimicrobium sp.]
MKKNLIKKLALNKQTVSNLNKTAMKLIRGGEETDYSCFVSYCNSGCVSVCETECMYNTCHATCNADTCLNCPLPDPYPTEWC